MVGGLDSSPGGKIPTSPSRDGKAGKGVILFYFYSSLFIYFLHALMLTACLFVGGPRARLPRGIWRLHLGRPSFVFSGVGVVVSSGAAVPQRMPAALCSTSLVCHLNEAFRAEGEEAEGEEEEERINMKTAPCASTLAANWPYFRALFYLSAGTSRTCRLVIPPAAALSIQRSPGASCQGRRGMKLTWCL